MGKIKNINNKQNQNEMKAHEIIKELKLVAPDGIHNLLPISEANEELRDYVHESKNKARVMAIN